MPSYNKFTIFDAYPESEQKKMLELVRIIREKYDKQEEPAGTPKTEINQSDRKKAGSNKHVLEKSTAAGKGAVQNETPINQTNLF